jgi:hypothetical protein
LSSENIDILEENIVILGLAAKVLFSVDGARRGLKLPFLMTL